MSLPAMTTYLYPAGTGGNPTQGRSLVIVVGGVARASSADAAADVPGFGFSNSGGTAVRCVNVGEVHAVELDPASAAVTGPGIKLMVTTDGLHKAFTAGDTGLCAGESVIWPSDTPPGSPTRNYTFTATGKDGVSRRYSWIRSAPVTVT